MRFKHAGKPNLLAGDDLREACDRFHAGMSQRHNRSATAQCNANSLGAGASILRRMKLSRGLIERPGRNNTVTFQPNRCGSCGTPDEVESNSGVIRAIK